MARNTDQQKKIREAENVGTPGECSMIKQNPKLSLPQIAKKWNKIRVKLRKNFLGEHAPQPPSSYSFAPTGLALSCT